MDTPIHSFVEVQSEGPTAMPAAPAGAIAVGTPLPPSGNTGGKFPSDEPDSVHPYAAITDYLNCTFAFGEFVDALPIFVRQLVDVLGEKFGPVVERPGKGHIGYKKSFVLGNTAALFAYGGQRGTALISLPGEACSVIRDWRPVLSLLSSFPSSRITRWDGAVDDFSGFHSVDYAVACYWRGDFNAGGKTPSCNQNGNWIQPDGTGRTFYVGKRKNGKMLRVYEKGMQLDHRGHPWVRWEVELHNVDRVIPWEVLLEPARYVVGSYPKALQWVQKEMCRIRTIQQQT
ncbi:replication initiation factor domain-containing protein [Massilia phyllosphaerae]|uniref:replication initiation factor domain-containing protein n=1 Tax=Massilia phyllosphaerae TaxID=3106034 RepID=UPI002B1CDB4B|nr:replication initiation factor domain-containing protein [Massilia sp. SGZ-792]